MRGTKHHTAAASFIMSSLLQQSASPRSVARIRSSEKAAQTLSPASSDVVRVRDCAQLRAATLSSDVVGYFAEIASHCVTVATCVGAFTPHLAGDNAITPLNSQ